MYCNYLRISFFPKGQNCFCSYRLERRSDRSKAVLLLWSLIVTFPCCAYLKSLSQLIVKLGPVARPNARPPVVFRRSRVPSFSPAKHSYEEIGHEIISTAILSLPLIQAGQLSVSGERMCTKYWLTA